MLRQVRVLTSISVVLAFEAFALVALHRLGSVPGMAIDWSDVSGWLADAPPEDAIAAVVRVIALGVAYWLTVTTVLYLLASLAGVPSLVRSVGWAMLPPVRRIIDGLVAASIVAGSTVTSPVVASADPGPANPVTVESQSCVHTGTCRRRARQRVRTDSRW